MEKYVARDPKTGKPLSLGGGGGPRHLDEAYRAENGHWDAIKHFDILPLASGDVQAIEVRWKEIPQIVTRKDAIKALPRIMRSDASAVQDQLLLALEDDSSEIKIAGLFSLPYCALVDAEDLFFHLDKLLDDGDLLVRRAASKCLKIVAPVFPSATEGMLGRELFSNNISRRKYAFAALKEMCQIWPEVVVTHLDEILRSDDDRLRIDAAKILTPLARTKSASVWDLITWSLGDENDHVRSQAARTLPTLASTQPRIAKILIENSLFDTCEGVRKPALRALNSMDITGFRMNRLCLDGARHSDPAIRKACILMMPRLFTDSEMRNQAAELLRQETKPDLIAILEELARDIDLEGGEDEKNRLLAPAPAVTDEHGSPILLNEEMPNIGQLPPPSDEDFSHSEKQNEATDFDSTK